MIAQTVTAMPAARVAADARAGMDVDGGQETREMVDHARQEIELSAVQPVADAVHAERQDARIKQHFPPRTRGRVTGLDRVQITEKS